MSGVQMDTDFDQEHAGRLMRDAVSLLLSFYPMGALEWLEVNRPDVFRLLRASEQEIDAAVLAGDQKRLVRALEVYTRGHQKAFEVFTCRPPVIERQGTLL